MRGEVEFVVKENTKIRRNKFNIS